MLVRKLNGCWRRLLFARQLTQRKYSLCLQGKKMPKLAQILEQSTKLYEAGICISLCSFLIIVQIHSMLPLVCSVIISNRSQKTSKCGENICDTLTCGSCATCLILPHFDVIYDLLLNRRTATWNLFVQIASLLHPSGVRKSVSIT